jgi:tetratricopeptide (TPR) repeat protein
MEYADMAQMEFATALQDEAAIATDPKEASELADRACGIYQEILRTLKSGKDHRLRKSAENNLANIIYFRARLCDNTAKVEMLQMAIDAYRAILKKQSRTTDVELYAYNQVNLAAALREQAICGELTQKHERLMGALKSFAIALEVFTPEAFPQRAARAQIGLGLTQFELSQDETLSQDKRDWFFKESLMNLFEATTQGSQDAEFIKNGREAIKMLQEVTIPEPNKANDL